MASASRFCPYCGTPLASGANFCPSCGQQTGAAPQQQAAPPAQPQVVYQVTPVQGYAPGYVQTMPVTRAKRRPKFWTVVGITLVVVLLLLLLARFVALQVVGETTLATVTSVELTDSEEYQYTITYRFVTADDKVATGSTTREELNAGNLPTEGDQIRVRYLPFWPAINQWSK